MLNKKNAIITGCNRGIGKAILVEFAKNGANVFAHARKRTEEFERLCEQLAEENKVRIYPVYFDARDNEQIKSAIKQIMTVTNEIDILVNNIGMVGSVKSFHMTTMQEIREEFEVNFFAQMEVTQYVSRYMIRRKKGSIINISACAGMDGNTGMIQYVSSKAALIGATKRLAIEMGQYGIRVNSVAPGLTETDMGNRMSPELAQETLNHQIFKRKAEPKEIADGVVFFASDLSTFVTGQVLRIDGGMLN